ncbi:hypothetical protein D8B26_002176 [Coccidioides posadasii str. Silveira]|uniref:Uncharacterized protein n=1 Tax=Coccidioides posadasii (strain RMSCC 757 / Silveira) TaxID=443226 RepID=E9CV89_COCPS|nr:conserved hypothetical protein [Coccidioides posadasii str. Silveira]QVM07477.1 hypothetical protein D8B26_002176 [Coccidioides posadasii str. Silveira]
MEIEQPIFNPAKRRKFIRRRATTPPAEHQSDFQDQVPELATNDVTQSATPTLEDDGAAVPIAEIIRARKGLKSRRAGIEFSTGPRWGSEKTPRPSSEGTVASEAGDGGLGGISDRFVGLTGQKVDVDRHMMTYIESEMAKRHRRSPAVESTHNQLEPEEIINQGPDHKLPQRQPATLGKLHEIDLGPDSKLRNIERTKAATRNLASGEPIQTEDKDVGGKKSRVDKDGKSWRHRKRRNSEDIRRDQLVEEVLRESKLDVYEEPEQEFGDDQAADDRIAEQFRRDFLDAIQSRRRGARSKNTKSSKGDVPRGPKLGGSRSARAAMRERQEKAAKK